VNFYWNPMRQKEPTSEVVVREILPQETKYLCKTI
jgi:hypothetical protein